MLLLGAIGEPAIQLLRFDRELLLQGQWWRAFTCVLVHFSGNPFTFLGFTFLLPWHLFLNVLGLLILVLLCPERLSYGVWLRRLFFLSGGMSLGLFFFEPEFSRYVGLSGVMHGFFLLGLLPQVLKKDLVASGFLLYLFGKLGYELYAGAAVSDEAAIGGTVLLGSHMWGAVSGLVYGVLFRSFWKSEQWKFWE